LGARIGGGGRGGKDDKLTSASLDRRGSRGSGATSDEGVVVAGWK